MESLPKTNLRIRLLGRCEFQSNAKVVRLESLKTSALLAYLALQAEPQPRHKLMGLLWGDLPEEKARRNLRHALWNLRRQFDSADRPSFFSSDPYTIQFIRRDDVWIDVTEFETRIQRSACLVEAAQPGAQIALLREALELYHGDLLEGFYIDDAQAFEEWLLVERERLRMMAIATLQQMITYDLAWGEYAEGLEYARRLLAMEPWREEAHRQMMRLLALSGQRSAALAQYEVCRDLLAEELNIEPSAETQALYESLRVIPEPEGSSISLPTYKLPPQTTPFIGRESELERIEACLHDPTCRLLTLVGPGGIGKTRLALQAAKNASQFGDGVFFVPLAGIGSSDLLIPAIADAIGFRFHSRLSAQAQLLGYLGDKNMLLVLDNFEHLVDGAGLIGAMLQATDRLKILATSRQRLNLEAEWLFEVEGLECPSLRTVSGDQAAKVDSCSAVRLFVQTAQRMRLGFVLADEDRPSVARLCQMLEGVPLAIELAAAWTRVLACKDIVSEVERNLDFLATMQRDVPARHRSMRAVFEHSWRLLGESEQAVFKRLAVFRGGFSLEAAKAVAQATPEILAALVDKCFIHQTPSARYEIHELLRQYGEEKMSSDEIKETSVWHSLYFAEFLHQQEAPLNHGVGSDALDQIGREIDNIRRAWSWMAQTQQARLLKHAYISLFRFCETRLHLQEGVKLFGEAVDAMRQAAPEPESRSVLAKCARLQARLLSMLGDQETARRLLGESLEIVRQLGEKKEEAFVLNNLGILAKTTGQYAQALQFYEASLAIKRELGEPVAIVITIVNLVQVMCLLGDYARAIELNREAQNLAQTLGAKDLIASILYFEGEIALGLNNFEEAQTYYEAALKLYRELAKSWAIADCLNGLAQVLLAKDDCEPARQLAEEGLAYAQQVGDAGITSACYATLGRIAEAQEDLEGAEQLYQKALHTALSTKHPPLVMESLIGIASIQAKDGQTEAAREVLGRVIDHPATPAIERARAARLRAGLEG